MARINASLNGVNIKDPSLVPASPYTPAHTSAVFKTGIGQIFRIRNTVTVTSNIASSSGNVDISPFWTTPSSSYGLIWAHVTIASALTATGSVTSVGIQAWIDTPGTGFNLINANSAGSFSSGTYGIGGTNKVRMSMASDSGLGLYGANSGQGNADYLVSTAPSSSTSGPLAGPMLAYGSSLFSKDVGIRIAGGGSWTLTGGVFHFQALGFFTG